MTFKASNPTTAGGSVGLGNATDWLADCTPRNTAEKAEVQGPSVALIDGSNPVCDFDPAKVNGQAKSQEIPLDNKLEGPFDPEDNPFGYDESEPEPDPQPRKSNKKKQSTKPTQQGFPPNFHLSDGGLFWKDPEDSDKPSLFITSHFQVVATTRDDAGNSWGLLLRWIDPDGRVHEWAMPRSMLAADAADVRRKLLDGGLNIAPSMKARNHLTSFLTGVKVEQRARAVSATGWYDKTFVLPDATIGEDNGERVILQTAGVPDHSYNVKGNLASWQDQVAKYAVGNSRLVLAISTAFAAPLVWPCGQESGGLHFRGSSSIGKTTALHVAGCVWGGGDGGGFVRSWRATANGLEAVAAHHNDSLLCLDELSQLNGREAGEVAYMLANGSGKSRAMRDASLRKPAKWRLLFLSSGEIGLADKVAEDVRGRRLTAGQQVRVVDVPADTGSSYGLFEELHGFADAGTLSKHLMAASRTNHGSAGREFVSKIAPRLDEVTAEVKTFVDDFLNNDVPDDADGQVRRVAARFALIAAAGEKAAELGVVPWEAGEAAAAAKVCFKAWLDARGGVEPAEVRDGINAVKAFLSANGTARFLPAWDPGADQIRIPNLAGFRRNVGEEGVEYFITAEAWAEVAAGFDPKSLAATLADRGLLLVPDERHRAKLMRIPGHGLRRVYHISPKLLGGQDA